MLQALRDGGLLDDTVVIVSADHGELLGEHGAWGKRSFYEASGGVPLLVHWPAGLPRGAVRQTPVSTIDLFPSLATMAGLPLPGPLDGLSLLAAAREGAALDRPGIAAEYGSERDFKLMWRWEEPEGGLTRQWKYVWLANGGKEQLFERTSDPLEQRNLASGHRDRCAAAHARLAAWCRDTDFERALGPDGWLRSMPFEPFDLGTINERAPAWPARDPDFAAQVA